MAINKAMGIKHNNIDRGHNLTHVVRNSRFPDINSRNRDSSNTWLSDTECSYYRSEYREKIKFAVVSKNNSLSFEFVGCIPDASISPPSWRVDWIMLCLMAMRNVLTIRNPIAK